MLQNLSFLAGWSGPWLDGADSSSPQGIGIDCWHCPEEDFHQHICASSKLWFTIYLYRLYTQLPDLIFWPGNQIPSHDILFRLTSQSYSHAVSLADWLSYES